jgi:hypothetical protein
MESAKIVPLNRNRSAASAAVNAPATPPKPKLLDQVRQAIHARHYSYRTEKAYIHWIKRLFFSTTSATRQKWAKLRSAGSFPV